jgi:hypothetical protein
MAEDQVVDEVSDIVDDEVMNARMSVARMLGGLRVFEGTKAPIR